MVHIPSSQSTWLRFFCILFSLFMSVNTSVNAEDAQKDTDKDGLTDAFELKIGSEAYLSDTDGDGIKDGDEIGDIENPLDTDSDKVIDVLDYDDDDDGLPTYLEAKGDSDKDGLLDYLDPDSDNDSILDGVEAAYLDQDKNFDGIDDAFDSNRKGFIDVNGDGIDDNVKLPDYNNDGIPDYLDNNYPKQNNNESTAKKTIESQPSSPDDKQTLKELSEAPTQKKSLNDEVAAKEKKKKSASVNSKENKTVKEKVEPPKVIVNKHTDTDNDGLSNDLERILKTDHLKRDTDGDNVSDAIEVGLDVNDPQDTDGDGIIDALDTDDDNDGVLTKLEDLNKDSTAINDDTDGDGIPNYLDDNDDGDTLLTREESLFVDSDGDGILDYLDKSDGKIKTVSYSNTIHITDSNEVSSLRSSSIEAPVIPKVINSDTNNPKAEVIVLYDASKIESNPQIVENKNSGFKMKISDVEPDITASVISANEIAASSLESPAGIDNVEIETETTNKDIAIEAIKDPVSSSVSKQEKRSPWVLF